MGKGMANTQNVADPNGDTPQGLKAGKASPRPNKDMPRKAKASGIAGIFSRPSPRLSSACSEEASTNIPRAHESLCSEDLNPENLVNQADGPYHNAFDKSEWDSLLPSTAGHDSIQFLKSLLRPIKHLAFRTGYFMKAVDIRMIILSIALSWIATSGIMIYFATRFFLISSSHSKAPVCPEQSMTNFLEYMRLQQYSSMLCSEGYELLEDLARASEDDLVSVGISTRPHRLRIMANVEMYTAKRSWPAYAVLAFIIAISASVSAVAMIIIIVKPARQRLQMAATIVMLVLWQKLMMIGRFVQLYPHMLPAF